MTTTIRIPNALQNTMKSRPGGAEWLAELDSTVEKLASEWSLDLREPFDNSSCSLVYSCDGPVGEPLVLKIGWPHYEARDEAIGLLFWEGDPTVEVHQSDLVSCAMLLEQCQPGDALSDQPTTIQQSVLSDLMKRLWKAPPARHGFRPLSEMIEYWTKPDKTQAMGQLFARGLEIYEELLETSNETYVLATDLHAGNVLSSKTGSWKVIDPKPFVGERAYDLTQYLMNNLGLVADEPDFVDNFAKLTDVDPSRVRKWLFARLATSPNTEDDDSQRRLAANLLSSNER